MYGAERVSAPPEAQPFQWILPMLSVDSARHSSDLPDSGLLIGAKLYKSEPAEICLNEISGPHASCFLLNTEWKAS